MITNDAYHLSAHEAASLVRPGGTILAEIDTRQATPLEAVREAAIALATTAAAQLVLLRPIQCLTRHRSLSVRSVDG